MMECVMKKDEFLTSVLGLGKLPLAPRIWATLPPVVFYQVLGYLWPAASPFVMAAFLLAGVWICVAYAPAVLGAGSTREPKSLVADALAGQALTMLIIAMFAPPNICNSMSLGFLLFLFFDFAKPWPCKRLRRAISVGFGVVADDLMAGLYAGVLAYAFIRMFPIYFGTCRVSFL
jgi:phosphatidylglycerophosphatase A